MAFFAQDDWRITPKLVINAGVRWEYESPVTEAHNIYSRIDWSQPTLTLLSAGTTGVSNSLNLTTPKLDLAPRVGLNYSLNSKTVLRAAYGSYYGMIFQNLGGSVGFPGYETTTSYNNLGTGIAQAFTLSQGMPVPVAPGTVNNPNIAVFAATSASPYKTAASYGNISPMTVTGQWNAGIQREIYKDTVVEVAYLGTHGIHNPLLLNVNYPTGCPGNAAPTGTMLSLNCAEQIVLGNSTVTTQTSEPLPTMSQSGADFNNGSSIYHSLQVSARRQITDNLAFGGSYTWAHSIDDGSGLYNYSFPNGLNEGQYPQNSAYRKQYDRATSSFDLRHVVNENASYKTHGRWYMRNFTVGETFSLRSGFPITITQTNEYPGVASQRPNGITKGLKIPKYKNGTVVQYFMPAPSTASPNPNFPLTQSGPIAAGSGAARQILLSSGLGSLGRNTVTAPGEYNFNATLARSITLHNNVTFQLRAEAYNLMNHTNFGSPSSSLAVSTTNNVVSWNSASFGQITTTDRPRFMQIVTRINF